MLPRWKRLFNEFDGFTTQSNWTDFNEMKYNNHKNHGFNGALSFGILTITFLVNIFFLFLVWTYFWFIWISFSWFAHERTNECARSMTECWLSMHTNGIIKTVLNRRLVQIKWLCRNGEIYLPINDHNTSIGIDRHFRWMQYWHWFNHCRSIQLDRFQIIGYCFGHYRWLACGLSVVGKKET